MGRTGKKKTVAESSSRGASKRKKRVVQDSDSSEEDFIPDDDDTSSASQGGQGDDSDEEMEDEDLDIPTWSSKKSRLSTFPENVQAALYRQKIEKCKFGKASLLLCERELVAAELERFGVVDCFRRLGWMQNLTKNNDTVEVYVEEIFEWMSTLQRSGSSAVTMVLAGMVHGKTVRLSFRTFESLGRFDTGAIGGAPYEYPSDSILNVDRADGGQWEAMIQALFVVPAGVRISSWTLYKRNMRPLPRLLHQIILANVMPRTSDKHKVRLFEVLVVHALMTGSPVLSARHLIMWSIWEARERKERMTVPFARLLSNMIKKAGAVPRGERGKKMIHIPFSIATVTKASDWGYEKTRRMHRLYILSSGLALEAPRSDVDDDDDDDDDNEGQGAGGAGPQVEPPRLMGYTEGMYGSPYYTHLQTAVANSRPTDFGDWSGSSQAVYDLLAQNVAEDQVHRRSMMYQLHEFRNEDFRHHEAIRHDADYARGWHHTWRPEPVDWTRPDIEPYEETQQLPRYPQATPSHYIPPHPYWAEPQQQQQPESSAAAHDPFETRTLSEALCESIFGPRITPREYDG